MIGLICAMVLAFYFKWSSNIADSQNVILFKIEIVLLLVIVGLYQLGLVR